MFDDKVYCFPKLGRAGLGNCMLPWARAVIYARQRNLPIIAAQWVQPRIGAFLRREKTTRLYVGEFTNAGYISGLRKWLILTTLPKRAEDELMEHGGRAKEAHVREVIVFSGLGNYFRDLWGHNELLRSEFLEIVRPTVREKLAGYTDPFIAMNVRRGDRVPKGVPEEVLKQQIWYTPLGWFVAAARAIRELPQFRDMPIYIVSDGWDHELEPLLGLPNCRRIDLGTTVGNLLFLSKATALFASGHSTFSMWASFFGQMPTFYCPGKWDEKVFPPSSDSFEGEWAEHELLEPLLRQRQ